MYQYMNCMNNLCEIFPNYFINSDQIHKYNTRNSLKIHKLYQTLVRCGWTFDQTRVQPPQRENRAVKGSIRTNMASRPKRVSQKPRRYIEEFVGSEGFLHLKPPKKPKKDSQLYEIEVRDVDREKKLVRIHYKGYDERYDEWRPYGENGESAGEYFPFIRQEKPHTLTAASLEDRAKHFVDVLYRNVKRSLYSGRKDDPDVRIEVDVMEDVFNMVLGNIVQEISERGKRTYTLTTNRALDTVLGQKWDERIVNHRGDFCYVAEGTTKYWLTRKASIKEFKIIGGKLVKTEIEGCCMVVFTFVRGTGNRVQYQDRM